MAESLRVQKITAKIQPRLQEIQEKYKDDKEKQTMLIMQLWQENKINPFASIIFYLSKYQFYGHYIEFFLTDLKKDLFL